MLFIKYKFHISHGIFVFSWKFSQKKAKFVKDTSVYSGCCYVHGTIRVGDFVQICPNYKVHDRQLGEEGDQWNDLFNKIYTVTNVNGETTV